MEINAFIDKAIEPTDRRLAQTLGDKAALWETVKKHLEENYGAFTEEWKFYNQKSGWTLKVLLKKRNLFFFVPLKGYFRMAFVFGDKAVAAVEKSDLPENLKSELKNARKYAEGRGIRIDVKLPKHVENVKKLIDIKIKN